MSTNDPNITQADIDAARGTEGYELKLATGEVYKGANLEEAARKLAEGKEQASRTIENLGEQVERLKQERDALRQRTQEQARPATPGNGFDKMTYYQLLETDPMQAQNYMDAYRFGYPDPNLVPQVHRQILNVAQEVTYERSLRDFYTENPDFPGGKEASTAVAERMEELGLPITTDNLGRAYRQLVREGTIKPVAEQEEEPVSRGRGAPPTPGTSDNQGWMSDVDLDSLTTEQLTALARKKGLLQY